MELKDHFNLPLSSRRHWHSFHNAWATYIAASLNHLLPEGYFAEPNVQFGIEIDVATFEEDLAHPEHNLLENFTIHQREYVNWIPPKPYQTLPFQLSSEIVEIGIFNDQEGPILTGAIELVSPANKDRLANKQAFVSKCATYLQHGVGLIIVDVVTTRNANLHNELLNHIVANFELKTKSHLYAAAYRVIEHNKKPNVDIWLQELEIGKVLPILPLWLKGNICLPIYLEKTYTLTCQEQRII
ncbi:hypothetical protein TI05_00545 [Achromatium sp. WMS3]|nr:hypothetical protein TI05_00545 [Achromatium sp. WMS3]